MRIFFAEYRKTMLFVHSIFDVTNQFWPQVQGTRNGLSNGALGQYLYNITPEITD